MKNQGHGLQNEGPPHPVTYTFGDADIAAERLRVLHDVFGEASRALLTKVVSEPPLLAYDLGCGPGHTTRELVKVTNARATIGLERSESYVARASANAPAGTRFIAWDVTETPFPAGPADLIYARFLLAHLKDPAAVVRAWATQLTEGGLLVLDEIEWIATDHPILAAHLKLSADRVATTGAQMCAGPSLHDVDNEREVQRRIGKITELPVATAAAATMFAMSLDAWGKQAVSDGLCDDAHLNTLTAALSELQNSSAMGEITWGLHQATYQHTGPTA